MNYWQKRNRIAQNNVANKSIKDIEKQLAKYYKQTLKRTIADFEATYDKLLATMDEGRQPTPADLYKLDKYWQMQSQLQAELQKLGDKELELFSQKFTTTYKGVYENLALPSERAFATIDTATARQMINDIWCADNKSWSSRIWDNTAKLAETLNEELIECVVGGKKTSDLKKKLMERFNVSYSQADSLARTEIAHIQTQAAQKRYKDAGLELAEVWADKDERRCVRCGELHQKRYKVGEKVPIPAHPNCRCCIIPVIDVNVQPIPEPQPEPKPKPKPKPEEKKTPEKAKATAKPKKATAQKSTNSEADIIKREESYATVTKELQALDEKIKQKEKGKAFTFTKAGFDKIEAELDELKNKRNGLMQQRKELAKGIDTLRPHKVAGVDVDKPMDFAKADGAKPNPHFNDGYEYKVNCQTCVVSYEARRRGYDVMATGNKKNGGANQQVSYHTALAWIDPETGTQPKYIQPVGRTASAVNKWCDKNLKDGERYTIEFGWRNYRSGHIVSMHKQDGELMIYDPQTSKVYKGEDITALLSNTKINSIKLLRVDNLEFNPVYVDDLLKASD